MTADDFRRLALTFPESTEQSHMDHPDFRVRGKIFATLGHPDAGWGVLMLTPQQQRAWVEAEPDAFVPVNGGWGARGATQIRLRKARKTSAARALRTAWENKAPKTLVRAAAQERS